MNKKIKKFMDANLGTAAVEMIPIKKGGSDREFFRVRLPDKTSFIFMHYGNEVEENAYWAGINGFLAGLKISVPQIVAQDIKRHFILLEDLGDIDLWSLAKNLWSKRRDYYFEVLQNILRLHSFKLENIPAGLKLSPGYSPKLYKWEHEYFIENFVGAACQLELLSAFRKKLYNELDALADRMLKTKPCLIHRDFQSQNIMIKDDKPVLIDFQGMRLGNFFYDLGSLICDPYVTFAGEERNELISSYYRIMRPPYGFDEFTTCFWEASAQRLMQALGAYGFLGLKKKKPAFLKHINNGLAILRLAVDHAPKLPWLKDLAMQCDTAIKNH